MGEMTEAKGAKPRTKPTALKGLGYKSLEAYFRARAKATFATMSRELGVSGETVRRWYRDWSGADAVCS